MSDFLILEMASVFGYLNNIRLDENEKYNAMAIEHEQLIKSFALLCPKMNVMKCFANSTICIEIC